MEAKYYGNICGKDPYVAFSQKIQYVSKKNIPFLVSPEQSITFLKNLRSRKEEFGGILYSREAKSRTIFITKDSINFFDLLKNRSFFTIYGLSTETRYSVDELQKLFGVLYQNGFVIPIEGGEVKC